MRRRSSRGGDRGGDRGGGRGGRRQGGRVALRAERGAGTLHRVHPAARLPSVALRLKVDLAMKRIFTSCFSIEGHEYED